MFSLVQHMAFINLNSVSDPLHIWNQYSRNSKLACFPLSPKFLSVCEKYVLHLLRFFKTTTDLKFFEF